ncbi:winged helix-turn-helix transcriptional regulator [Haloarcula sp. S1CR25-12]|uniref:Winged helix-turn-helix transcriptional regulator n=1 Tax=Haloarcula saliterrae TaxID=2950534 RepID=A0ABU2FGU9_9EURY|nr:winged helix-turn-helix transcriptional regulator [Haloarcula sp. S1CR25-12]MDS0261489.1 winged helix-turn-helix transcriptional regulator [Haloarcula sp. S1CR25-12]
MVSDDVRELIGRKRTIEILELLIASDSLNYSEIESEIASSSDTITDALELLCEHELVERVEEGPKNVKYHATETGQDFHRAIEAIEDMLRE